MIYFVNEVVKTGHKSTGERNVRLGGYKSLKSAERSAVKHAPALVRDCNRTIVKQTINKEYPNYCA